MKMLLARVEALERRRSLRTGYPGFLVRRERETLDEAWQQHVQHYGQPPRQPWRVIELDEDISNFEWEKRYGTNE